MGLDHDFFDRGWVKFTHDPALAQWVVETEDAARAAAADPQNITDWLRHDGTWFAGVNILPNDTMGCVENSNPLQGKAVEFLKSHGMWTDLDRAQVSVMYPGYPGFDGSESQAAFRYRRDRDAAHVDGLLPEGPNRRRYVREPHGFVLGVPMVSTAGCASPMVVWDKSHHIMRDAFAAVLQKVDVADWPDVDLTDAYHDARRVCFETCDRIEVPAQPGESYILHRLTLHGIAPWGMDAQAGKDGRMIAYFRPDSPGGLYDWLHAP